MTSRSPGEGLRVLLAALVAAGIGFAMSRIQSDRAVLSNEAAGRDAQPRGARIPLLPIDSSADEQDSQECRRPLQFNAWMPMAIAGLALGGMIVFLLLAPRAAAGGWLLAFVMWSSIPIGSVTVMMIHALTGGRWGRRFNAVFMPSAAAVPLLAVLFIPVLVALPEFFAWTGGSGRVESDVSQYYLNVPFFIGRSLIAFCVWSLIAYALPRLSGWLAVLIAGIGLAFHGLIIGVIGVDWILSLEPVFVSTSFGASLAFTQLATAMAWALVVSPDRDEDEGLADVGGLLLATLLGTTYVNFMALLIIWYGDLPHRVFWLVHRDHWPWTLIAGLAFVFGSVIPIFALFFGRIRASSRALRIVGVIALVGIAVYYAYLVAPPFGLLSLAAASVALVAMGGLLIAFFGTSWSRAGYIRWSSTNDG